MGGKCHFTDEPSSLTRTPLSLKKGQVESCHEVLSSVPGWLSHGGSYMMVEEITGLTAERPDVHVGGGGSGWTESGGVSNL